MTTPVFQREGCRTGGVTQNGFGVTARTDSNGANLWIEVSVDPNFAIINGTSTSAPLNASNNYQNTTFITGLSAGRKYYYRCVADDGFGNKVTGTREGFTLGSVRTIPSEITQTKTVWMSCNPMLPGMLTNDGTKQIAIRMWNGIYGLHADLGFNLGDVYYSDIYSSNANSLPDYSEGAWRAPIPSDTVTATAGAYRTNFISCYDELRRIGMDNYMVKFQVDTPTCWMWDDHDSGWNDCNGFQNYEGDAARYAKYQRGTAVADECFMDLNKPYIEQENGRIFQHGVNPAPKYYYVDVPGTRFIVWDIRTYRSWNTDADIAGVKSMLGAEQLQWVKDRISDNPHRNLVIGTPMMLDGNHGWDEAPDETWRTYSWERDEILDHIREFGNPATTIVVSGDTHTGSVARYDDYGLTEGAIDEWLAGNLWPVSYHDYINGWGEGDSKLEGGAPRGGRLLTMRVNKPCVVTVDLNSDGTMTAGLYEPVTKTMVMKKTY
jgi:phosphodiesterase/alkaline phosphatase D-like protein